VVDLDKLATQYAEQDVTVIVVGYGDQSIAANADSYENLREAFGNSAHVRLFFDPRFDPPRTFKMNAQRTTWLIDQQGILLFEDCSTMLQPFAAISPVLDSCLAGSPPAAPAELATLPEPIETASILTQEDVDRALSGLRTNYDDFSEITWYYDRRSPRYSDRNGIFLYIGKQKQSAPWLRFRIQYAAEKWLFIEEYKIKADGTYFTISPGFQQVERDNGAWKIWEWYDCAPDDNIMAIVAAIIAADEAQIRHVGKQYSDTRTITQAEKKSLDNILAAFDILNRAVEQGLVVD